MINWIFNLIWGEEWQKLGGMKRSPKWSALQKQLVKEHPFCSACLKTKNLIAHHKKPFSLFPELELEKSNILILCEGSVVNCHFLWGHCFLNWKSYNENVERDIQIITNLRNNAQPKKESFKNPSQ